LLDDAGIQKATVLSEAYWFDRPEASGSADELFAKVRAENDWTARQVAQFPGRLAAFCSFNPLRDYALAELERCARSGSFRGVKLHFNTSGVDLRRSEHVARVRRVFETADRFGLALVVHARTRPTYGAEEARIILEQLVSAAPHVPIQIAHLWGGEALSEEALTMYADAVSGRDPRFANVYFDVAELALVVTDKARLQKLADRMRQIGLHRILYGSDAPETEAKPPAEAWALFRASVPLSDEEMRIIAGNVAPYLR
jgi:predicted TIM-barrel fold metal-dependent hydrolase